MLNLGINIVVPACDPVNNLTSKTLLLILVTIPLDPLQTPSPRFRFLKMITGDPTFNFNFASGNPEQLIEFKYSTGYRRSSLPFSPLFFTDSALTNSLSSPGKCFRISELMSYTSSFLLVRMVCSAKY